MLKMYEKIRKRNNAYHFLTVYYVVVHYIISAEVFTVTPSDIYTCMFWLVAFLPQIKSLLLCTLP